MMTTGAFQIGATGCGVNNYGKKKGPVCVFCKGAHPTYACESVTDHQKWLDMLREINCASTIWHITKCHSASLSFNVRNARRETTPLCAIVSHHLENPHVTR